MSSVHFPHASQLANQRAEDFMNTLDQTKKIHEDGKEFRKEIEAEQQK